MDSVTLKLTLKFFSCCKKQSVFFVSVLPQLRDNISKQQSPAFYSSGTAQSALVLFFLPLHLRILQHFFKNPFSFLVQRGFQKYLSVLTAKADMQIYWGRVWGSVGGWVGLKHYLLPNGLHIFQFMHCRGKKMECVINSAYFTEKLQKRNNIEVIINFCDFKIYKN